MMRNCVQETITNRLGHIKSSNILIYKTIGVDSFIASTKNTNRVYYVKTQKKYEDETYYVLSINLKDINMA